MGGVAEVTRQVVGTNQTLRAVRERSVAAERLDEMAGRSRSPPRCVPCAGA